MNESVSMEYIAISVSISGLAITVIALWLTISHSKKQLIRKPQLCFK